MTSICVLRDSWRHFQLIARARSRQICFVCADGGLFLKGHHRAIIPVVMEDQQEESSAGQEPVFHPSPAPDPQSQTDTESTALWIRTIQALPRLNNWPQMIRINNRTRASKHTGCQAALWRRGDKTPAFSSVLLRLKPDTSTLHSSY